MKVQEKEKEVVVLCSTKREIRNFHVVVLQRWQRNVQESGMHAQVVVLLYMLSYCFFAVLVALAP